MTARENFASVLGFFICDALLNFAGLLTLALHYKYSKFIPMYKILSIFMLNCNFVHSALLHKVIRMKKSNFPACFFFYYLYHG